MKRVCVCGTRSLPDSACNFMRTRPEMASAHTQTEGRIKKRKCKKFTIPNPKKSFFFKMILEPIFSSFLYLGYKGRNARGVVYFHRTRHLNFRLSLNFHEKTFAFFLFTFASDLPGEKQNTFWVKTA